MVLETILENFAVYVFGNYWLLGIAILFAFMFIGINQRIDKNALVILSTPLLLALAQFGYISSVISSVVFIGIMFYWGIMFKEILGKK